MPRKIVFISLLIIIISLHCGQERGLEPTRSGLSGTVFFNKTWPEATDEVMVVAALKFPPTTITEIVTSEPLPNFVDKADFIIWTPPQTFAAVGVVWKEKNQPWDVTNIIGIYFPTDNHFAPGSVAIPDKNTLVEGIEIQADLSKARLRVSSGIEGTLQATGVWPAEATQVLMIASPSILPTSLLDIAFGIPIPAGFDSTHYSLTLQPGVYRLIGALLIEENKPIGIESIKAIYKKKPTDFLPGSVALPTDTTLVTNVNLTLEF